jgi:hypothetical protein
MTYDERSELLGEYTKKHITDTSMKGCYDTLLEHVLGKMEDVDYSIKYKDVKNPVDPTKTCQMAYIQAFSSKADANVDAEKEKLVILHGMAQSSIQWILELPGLLAEGYEVYLVDLIDHGLSDRVEYLDAEMTDVSPEEILEARLKKEKEEADAKVKAEEEQKETEEKAKAEEKKNNSEEAKPEEEKKNNSEETKPEEEKKNNSEEAKPEEEKKDNSEEAKPEEEKKEETDADKGKADK